MGVPKLFSQCVTLRVCVREGKNLVNQVNTNVEVQQNFAEQSYYNLVGDETIDTENKL